MGNLSTEQILLIENLMYIKDIKDKKMTRH